MKYNTSVMLQLPAVALARENLSPPENRVPRDKISRETVHRSLLHLGIKSDPAFLNHIDCWDSLQRFVHSRQIKKPVLKPNANVRLRTYDLDQGHPVKMLFKHVIS